MAAVHDPLLEDRSISGERTSVRGGTMSDQRDQQPTIIYQGPRRNSFESCMGCVGIAIFVMIGLAFFGATRNATETSAPAPVSIESQSPDGGSGQDPDPDQTYNIHDPDHDLTISVVNGVSHTYGPDDIPAPPHPAPKAAEAATTSRLANAVPAPDGGPTTTELLKSDPDLAAQDREVQRLYENTLAKDGTKWVIIGQQRALAARARCRTVDCLREWVDRRETELKAYPVNQ